MQVSSGDEPETPPSPEPWPPLPLGHGSPPSVAETPSLLPRNQHSRPLLTGPTPHNVPQEASSLDTAQGHLPHARPVSSGTVPLFTHLRSEEAEFQGLRGGHGGC